MNSYSLGISGSWLLFIALLIFGLGLAWFTYRHTVPPVSSAKKAVLIGLRSFALALLLFAIFEPVLTMISGGEEPPGLAVLLDKSVSVATEDASGDRKELYMQAIENSAFPDLNEDDTKVFLFDEDIELDESFNPDSLEFDGQLTDISAAFRVASASLESENIQAALLITDGAFNAGSNPIYNAEKFGKPVYVIGIGDSTEPRDISIQTIITNEIAYIDNPVPVNVNVKVHGYEEGDITLELLDNGQMITEQVISLNPDMNNYSAVFEYMPKTEGMHKVTGRIATQEGEISSKNNILSEYIKVMKNKRRISIFAGAPGPDVSFLKTELKKEKGVEITSFIQKKGSEFYGDPPTASLVNQSDIIVLVGFPIRSTPPIVIDMIEKALAKGKSLLFIASKQTDYRKLAELEKYLPFRTISSTPREFLVVPDVQPRYLSSPLLRVNGTEEDLAFWNNLPPVFRTETFVRAKPESEWVSGIKVNNVPMKEPMILSMSFQDRKSMAILAYGLHRWKLMGYASEYSKGREDQPDLYSTLIKNSMRWLSVSDKSKFVRIKPTKSSFTNNESVEFLAQVYDKAFSAVDNAQVSLKISGGEQVREIILNSIGNGRYKGRVEGLSQGDYALSGDARVDSRLLGSDRGRFSVGEIALEYQNLRMNSELLRTIAERTGGKFYLPDESGSFIDDMKKHKLYVARSYTDRDEWALWNLPWILAIAIACFGMEWFIRKRSGMV